MMNIEGKTYYNWKDLSEVVGRTLVNLRVLRAKGFFPQPDVKPGGTSALWSADTINHWLTVTEPELLDAGVIYKQRGRKNKKRTAGQYGHTES